MLGEDTSGRPDTSSSRRGAGQEAPSRSAERARSRAEFAARRARAMPLRHQQRLANLTRSPASAEFLDRMGQLAEKASSDTRPDTCTSMHMSDKLLVMAGERSAATMQLPASTPVRAMLAGEIARAVRRSQATRRALTTRDLAPWLALVDAQCPDLIDVERVRIARIWRKNTSSSTPDGG